LEGTGDEMDKGMIDDPYSEAIGNLMYAMIGIRPDIAYVVGVLSRFCASPQMSHWKAVKRVLTRKHTPNENEKWVFTLEFFLHIP